jgi:hypothetical protein
MCSRGSPAMCTLKSSSCTRTTYTPAQSCFIWLLCFAGTITVTGTATYTRV